MITVNNKFHIPNQWEELSPTQFCKVGGALHLLEQGKVRFEEFKLLIIYALLDGDPKPQPENEIYCENLFRLGEHITFLYKFHYPDIKFQSFPVHTQEYLAKKLPTDMGDPFHRIASKMEMYVEADLLMSKQLLPMLPETKLKGYTFSEDEGVVNTNLTALQYTDANIMLQMFHSTGKKSFLEHLVRILYCPYPYLGEKAEKISLKGVKDETMYAVMYNYTGITAWISALPKYDILFNAPKKKNSKNPLGPNAPLYTLTGQGYGSLNEVGAIPLFSYLDLLLKLTVDAVAHLESVGKKKSEIAAQLNLSIDQINTIL